MIAPQLGLYFRKFTAFYLGCLSCVLFQSQTFCSAITASAAVGFVATFLPLPKRFNREQIEGAVYSGSFAGMCSREILPTNVHIFIISLIGAFLYVLTIPHLKGFGGKLGAVAFVASLLIFIARFVQ